MNIALIITGLGMGGAERQVCDLADQFVTLGHKVLLISMTAEVTNRPVSSAVTVIELNMVKTLIGFVKAYLLAKKILEQFKPDVVHSHMVHANIFSRLLRLSIKFPYLVCTAHNTNEGSRARMFAYRITDKLCDISTNVSDEAVAAFVQQKAVPVGRMVAMYNGIDTERFAFNAVCRQQRRSELGLMDKTPLLLAVGRLTAAKDYINLLNGFNQLSEKYNHVQLAIIGVGEDEEKLKQFVIEKGITQRVHFLGLRRDVHEWMSAADVYVMSSAWEGMPLVLLEAMACERVVVATDCGGVKEVMGDCGILVPARNSAALAQGLAQGLGVTSESARQQGQLARQRIVACYSLSAQAERWLQLYQSE